jgi:hypothetical protein
LKDARNVAISRVFCDPDTAVSEVSGSGKTDVRADRPTDSWTLATHENEKTARRIPKSGKQGSRPVRSPRIYARRVSRSPLERMFGFAARALMEAGGIEIAPPAAFHNATRPRPVDFRILRVFSAAVCLVRLESCGREDSIPVNRARSFRE